MTSRKLSAAAADSLRQLDAHLNPLWQLGRNAVLAWTTRKTGVALLVVSVHELLAQLTKEPGLLRGPRFLESDRFAELAKAMKVEAVEIITSLRVGAQEPAVPWQTVEGIIRRYSITETLHRGVMLFDIVGFSKLDSLHQIGQLNSLEYCINAAHRRMQSLNMPLELARSTTGDGFYVWNRNVGLVADVALLTHMLLVLAENEQERAQDRLGLTPRLRAAFSVGRHYAYYQIEGLSPRGYDYIVGDVTITLARLIQKTGAGQMLVGAFERPVREGSDEMVSAPDFVVHTDRFLRRFVGRDFGGHPISEVSFSLSGTKESGFDRLVIDDKHGLEHFAHNAVAKFYRGGRVPILLGSSGSKVEPEDTHDPARLYWENMGQATAADSGRKG